MARSSLHNQMCKVTGSELCFVLGTMTWRCLCNAAQSAAAVVPYSCWATLQMSGPVPDVQPSATGCLWSVTGCLWSVTGCHLHGCAAARKPGGGLPSSTPCCLHLRDSPAHCRKVVPGTFNRYSQQVGSRGSLHLVHLPL